MAPTILQIVFALLAGRAFATSININSAAGLINISKSVKSGTNYQGTTVYLDADIDLKKEPFSPIGSSSSGTTFRGMFDARGHTISNLFVNTTEAYGGLFGLSSGLIARNLVLDSSCEIKSYSKDGCCVGSVVGGIDSSNPTLIEGIVNMATLSFSGFAGESYVAGIVGISSGYSHDVVVRNSVNYGAITDYGTTTTWSELGGIIGNCLNSMSDCYVQNCANYGNITNSGASVRHIAIGGILASCVGTCYVDNCVNFGTMRYKEGSGYLGAIIGYAEGDLIISNCYWPGTIGSLPYSISNSDSTFTDCYSFSTGSFELKESVSIGDYTGNSLIDVLNSAADFYAQRDYSHWALNPNRSMLSLMVDNDLFYMTDSPLILLLALANSGSTMFYGWYADNDCTVLFTEFRSISVNRTAVYGKAMENKNNYTISFDTRGGSYVSPITLPFGAAVILPENPLRDNCEFKRWEGVHGDKFVNNSAVPARNVTLYAVWACTRIASVDDFMWYSTFASDSIYTKATVFLDTDIDLSGVSYRFKPIGAEPGVFDGQGHTISNLEIVSSSSRIGLFKRTSSTTIKNLVMDSSCSIRGDMKRTAYETLCIGGVVGYFYSNWGSLIENVVNMASVSDNINMLEYTSYIGGIAGSVEGNGAVIRNCANYGSVQNSGSDEKLYAGGIVGHYAANTYNSGNVLIYNCANYGPIANVNSAVRHPYIGGIVGHCSNLNAIYNCVSGGTITSSSDNKYIGSIAGYLANSNMTFSHCKWTADTGTNKTYGDIDESSVPAFNKTNFSSLDPSEIELLDRLSVENGWSRWITVHLNGGLIKGTSLDVFAVTPRHLPTPYSEGKVFVGYFTTPGFTEAYDPSSQDSVTDVYAKWTVMLTITFIFDNGTVLSNEVEYNSTIEYPEDSKDGMVFICWVAENGTEFRRKFVLAENVTLRSKFADPSSLEASAYVEIVFSKSDLTKREIENIIRAYSMDDFTIEVFENDEGAGKTRVIVKFTDHMEANKFVDEVKDQENEGILGVAKVYVALSESSYLRPMSILFVLVGALF